MPDKGGDELGAARHLAPVLRHAYADPIVAVVELLAEAMLGGRLIVTLGSQISGFPATSRLFYVYS